MLTAETARSLPPRFEKNVTCLLKRPEPELLPVVLGSNLTKRVDFVSSCEDLVKAVSLVLTLERGALVIEGCIHCPRHLVFLPEDLEHDHDLPVDLELQCHCDPPKAGDFQSDFLPFEKAIHARCWQQSERLKFPVVETEYF